MASKFELVNDLSILQAGRRPEWVAQVDPAYPNGMPVPGSGIGVYLQNVLKTLIKVNPREESYRRTSYITIAFDGASTYTVDIDGNAVATPADTDVATTIGNMADDINADSPGAGDVVLATAIESDPGVSGIDTLLLQGLAEDDYIVTLSVAGGAGTIAGDLEYTEAKARVFFTGRQPNIGDDYQLANGATYTIDRRGFIERFDTAGLDRCYVELFDLVEPADVAGAAATKTYRDPSILIGPAVLEVTET